jgi:hypothetical protein
MCLTPQMSTAPSLRYLGISEASAGTVRRAHASAPLSAVQTEYSLFSRQVESNGVLATARELGTHLEENIAASQLPMSAESWQALARVVSPGAVTGDRRSPLENVQD